MMKEKLEPTRKSGRLKKSRGFYAPTVAKIEYLQLFTNQDKKEENKENEKSN